MSAYFTITAVAPTPVGEVLRSLHELESECGDHIDVYQSTSGSLLCLPGQMLHDSEGFAAALSKMLAVPTIDLQFSDDVVWGYTLYQAGAELDRYSSRPNYWENQSPEDALKQAGNAAVVALAWPGVQEDEIAGYLTNKETLAEDGLDSLAYPGDKSSEWDAWQLCDFMRKLSLDYPIDENGEPTSQPIASMKIGTAKGLKQKADFEQKSKAVQQEMAQYREQLDKKNG